MKNKKDILVLINENTENIWKVIRYIRLLADKDFKINIVMTEKAAAAFSEQIHVLAEIEKVFLPDPEENNIINLIKEASAVILMFFDRKGDNGFVGKESPADINELMAEGLRQGKRVFAAEYGRAPLDSAAVEGKTGFETIQIENLMNGLEQAVGTGSKTDILVINPGSTSTKIAVFTDRNERVLLEHNFVHDEKTMCSFSNLISQLDYRKKIILDFLTDENYDFADLRAVVGRGGMLYGLEGGGYRVNEKLCTAMADPDLPQHASNLGAILAYSISEPLGIPSYIYDSVMGCDLIEAAKITGIAGLEKHGMTHLLNSRAQAIAYADSIGRDYQTMSFINCHMGGGITVNAMKGGKVIDVASYDDGPMSPERSGGVPLLLFLKMCFDGKYSEEEMKNLVAGAGGLYSYLGTKDCREVEKMIENGNAYAATVYEAMALQIAKAIGALSCTLEGKVDLIILTGGIAYSSMLTDMVRKYCRHIAPIIVKPGEKEMESLANGCLRLLDGIEETKLFL